MANREIWKPVPGYEGFYEVSSLGRIRGVDRVIMRKDGKKYTVKGAILSPSKRGYDGYLDISLRREGRQKTHKIHRLVMLTFVGEPPEGKYEVDHKDGDPENNRLSNLEYVSKKENYMRMAANQGRGALVERLEQLEKRVSELEVKLGGQDE